MQETRKIIINSSNFSHFSTGTKKKTPGSFPFRLMKMEALSVSFTERWNLEKLRENKENQNFLPDRRNSLNFTFFFPGNLTENLDNQFETKKKIAAPGPRTGPHFQLKFQPFKWKWENKNSNKKFPNPLTPSWSLCSLNFPPGSRKSNFWFFFLPDTARALILLQNRMFSRFQ